MNKMLKNICLANSISLDDPEAERKAMDILTGNDGEAQEHETKAVVFYLCGMCEQRMPSDIPVNVFGHIMCPHCNTPNLPNKP